MSWALPLKALLGSLVVVIIALLSRTKNFYIAGLVPLFPTFTLIAHYIVGTTRTHAELKTTILFSICGMIPLLIYLVAVYALIDRMRLEWALICSSALCCVAAAILLLCWAKLPVSPSLPGKNESVSDLSQPPKQGDYQ